MHKGFSVSCVLAIWLILGQAQTVDETRIDKAIRTVKEFCLYGTQFDLKADAKGNLTFKNLRQPGGEGSVSVNVRESKGAAAIFEEKLRIIADTAVRDCMRPHLPTIIRAILDQTEPTTSIIPPEGETSTPMSDASATAQRQEKLPGRTKLVVLVPPFENLSTAKSMITYQVPAGRDLGSPRSSFNVDRYTEAPRSILEDILGEIGGVMLVERKRVDAILLESEFGRLSGLVDPNKAVKLGKLLGANTIIMGSILDVGATTRNFSGYGIRTKNTEVKCSIRIRVIDIETGKVPYSKVIKGSKTYAESSFGGITDSNVAYAAIEAALEHLREDKEFKYAIFGLLK